MAPRQTLFGRGINVLGYSSYWSDPSGSSFRLSDFQLIRNAGFDFVRVNLFVFPRLDARNRVDPAWLERLDKVVEGASRSGLGVILDVHDSKACSEDRQQCEAKLTAIWTQLSARYRNAPDKVAFELLNEPHGAIKPDVWNSLIGRLVRIIRATNPNRTIVVAARTRTFTSTAVLELPPNDPHILVTFHYYKPERFALQGATFSRSLKNIKGVSWGSPADRGRLHNDMERVAEWAREHRRPILLGEFGVYDKSGIPMELRAAWTRAVACEAERHGFSWSYWQFTHDFAAWDSKARAWVEPIRQSLMRRSPAENNGSC